MPTNRNALLRYQVLDRCFSIFNNELSVEEVSNLRSTIAYPTTIRRRRK